jgi:hypothetical protein
MRNGAAVRWVRRTASVSSASCSVVKPAASAIDPPAVKLGQEMRNGIEPQPARQPLRCFDLAIGANQQRQRRAFIDHPPQPLGMAQAGLGLSFARARRTDRPKGSHGPPGQHQAK